MHTGYRNHRPECEETRRPDHRNRLRRAGEPPARPATTCTSTSIPSATAIPARSRCTASPRNSCATKPKFAEIAAQLRDFVADAELIIHNAPFDIGFLDMEFSLLGLPKVMETCAASVIDTLVQAQADVPRQAQFARRAVRPLRHQQRASHAARRTARLGAARRGRTSR